MSRYVDAEYVKAVMLNDRLMQGNAEYELYKQKVDAQVKAMPSIDLVLCRECSKRKKNGFCLEHNRYERNDEGFCSYGERE
jgi:hypothetical protein